MSVADRIASLTPEQRALFEKLREKQRKAAQTHQPPPIRRLSSVTGEGDWPLSLDQERFWFMEQLNPSGAGLNITAATRMRGPLSVPAVATALNEIVRRHAAWRTAFPVVDGGPVQRVSAARRQALAVIDLSGLPEDRREPEALRLVGTDVAAPFDLEYGPLVRSSLVRLGGEDHLCLLTVHHLVTDFLSFQIAWGELAAFYGGSAALPEPPVQYPDFAVWQREWLQGEVLEDLVSWWRERLEGFPLALDLPTDRPRPAVMRMRGDLRQVRVPRGLSEALRTLARGEGATLFMAVLAATASLIHGLSRQERLILGANNANRNRPEIEPVLGCFLTQVPFPIDLSGDPTVRELLARVRQSALGAYAHQDLPFGKLVEALQPRRDTSRQPLIQSLVQVLDGQPSKVDLAGVTFEAVDAHDGKARYDLMLSLFDGPEGLGGSLEFDTDLFDPTTAERWVELLLLRMAVISADPGLRLSALPVLSEAARHQASTEWNDTARPLPDWTVPERFAAQAARTPEALAVVAGGSALTYGDLDRLSDALTARLRSAGAGPGSRVALLLGRTPDVPVAILAVWKAGGAFVPLDPDAPTERLRTLLDDAEPAVLIHRGPLPGSLGTRVRFLDLDAKEEVQGGTWGFPAPSDLAYLIYTSGTTGRPKAVMVEHGSLASTLASLVDRLGFGPGDRVPQLYRFTGDISLAELFTPLLSGGTSEILANEEVLDPEGFLAAMERSSGVFGVPALLHRLVAGARERGPVRFAGLRTICAGGEMVPPVLQQDILATFPAARLFVFYGPTEAAILCTGHQVSRTRPPERPLIGWPLDRVEVRLNGPLGVPGELWIGGPGVACGYFRREELTAERFVEVDGRRFYRTGDLVRQVPSEGGALEFLGRTDFQVKVRGFRIEPEEIEAALLEHPAVREAVVVALGEGEDRRLAAYVAPEDCEASELRQYLADRLPAYMVPSAFVALPELPLAASGKVDRSRLPAPGVAEEESEPPRTPAEEIVAGIWCEVLDLPRVSRSANFFELGGHSLLATQVVSRLRAATGAELQVRDLFQSPTVATLAASLSEGTSAAPPIQPVPRDTALPLSFAQERLWFLDRLAPGNAAYNIPLVLAARGDLSLPALSAALGEMVRRHEALRTRYEARGDRPVQVIAPASIWMLPLVDLTALSEETRQREAWRLASEEVARPFDLERDPVLRARVLRLDGDGHALLLTIHHIAADGWSMGVMVEEIATLYPAALAGAPSPLPELAVQYADFAVWQREWLQGEVLDRQLGYWRERLAGAPALDLPTDRPRPAVQSFHGATRLRTIDSETARALEAFARRHDATLFMVLLAAVQALLGRWAGQDDVVVGSPIANRTRAEIEPLIGFFVNSLALRGDLGGDPSFGELVARARRSALEAYAHQDLPFERLVEELRPDRRLAHNPIFQVMFAVQNAPLRAFELPGLAFSQMGFEFPATRFDLELFFTETDGGLATQLTWSTDLFDPATALRLESHLDALLAAVLADPSQRLPEIPLLSAPERSQLLREWRGAGLDETVPDPLVLLLARAAAAPDAPAVVSAGGRLTYGELVARASRLARELRGLGVGPDVPVGLHAGRSPELVLGAVAVLLAGGAYVPLDPSQPGERLAYMARESGMPVLLSAAGWTGEGVAVVPLDLAGPAQAPPSPAVPGEPESLAYVLYTSGSTGRPKGVQVPRGGLAALVAWHLRAYGMTERDRSTLVASPMFDASVWEIWPCLAAGACLCIPEEETRLSPERLLAWLAAERITLSFLPTPLAEQLLEAAERETPPGLSLRALLTGGDRLRRAPRCTLPFTLVNHYGPTESSVVATWTPVEPVPEGVPARPPGIGRAVDGTRVYVLDRRLAPVPAGIPGELAIGGAGLARGYLGRPDLTAERFVPDPFAEGPGERVYLTGDRVLWRPEGGLEFLGRTDYQIKLRGVRIELGEVEAALERHPRVGEAAVAVRDGGSTRGTSGPQLVAWVVQRPAPESEGEAAQHISQWQGLYEETYGRGPATGGSQDPAFNIQGWNSSYTGGPIPAGEMHEWVEGTVERLLALPHRRVVEVGCGTGLLLFRVAPHAESYLGTDFSAAALGYVRSQIERSGGGLGHVELARTLADDWSGVEPGETDLVVLNSVVQYFPSPGYLARVLEGAVRAVAPGGAVFVGDVRSLPLLPALHASIELFQAPAGRTVAEMRQRIARRVADEEELVVDPAFFAALARRLPEVRRVEVLLKRGRVANELTRFRYDVILHAGEPGGGGEPRRRAWETGEPSLADLERRLATEAPDALALRGLPNARLEGEAAALDLLVEDDGRDLRTAAELRAEVNRRVQGRAAVEPEDLWTLADRLGYDAELSWSPDGVDGRFDAVLRRRGAGVPAGVEPAAGEERPWSSYTNDPLNGSLARRLVPELRRFLEAELPEAMIPSVILLIDVLPRTPSGKIDRAALPAPERPAGPEEEYVPPSTPLEESLAAVCAEVLGLDRVGLRDNFFALGGHSLLATQFVSRLSQDHGIDVSLQMVFDAADLGALADRVVERELAAADGELLDEMLQALLEEQA